MTYEDVKRIRENPTAEIDTCDIKELQRLLTEAVEKQIPKKPLFWFDGNEHKVICPSCKKYEIDMGLYEWARRYCGGCGQRIDYSEVE